MLSQSYSHDEAKEIFKVAHAKYGTLWKSMANDPFVKKEYERLLSIQSKQLNQSNHAKHETNDVLQIRSRIPLSSNNNQKMEDNAKKNGGSDDQRIDDEDVENRYNNDTRKVVATVQQTTNTLSTDQNSEMKPPSNKQRVNDFMTAIDLINNNNVTSTNFQLSSSCCDIFGCNNNCSEPILLEEEDGNECVDSSSLMMNEGKYKKDNESKNETNAEGGMELSETLINNLKNLMVSPIPNNVNKNSNENKSEQYEISKIPMTIERHDKTVLDYSYANHHLDTPIISSVKSSSSNSSSSSVSSSDSDESIIRFDVSHIANDANDANEQSLNDSFNINVSGTASERNGISNIAASPAAELFKSSRNNSSSSSSSSSSSDGGDSVIRFDVSHIATNDNDGDDDDDDVNEQSLNDSFNINVSVAASERNGISNIVTSASAKAPNSSYSSSSSSDNDDSVIRFDVSHIATNDDDCDDAIGESVNDSFNINASIVKNESDGNSNIETMTVDEQDKEEMVETQNLSNHLLTNNKNKSGSSISISSEEAEWTENEDEPLYTEAETTQPNNVIILSDDESLSEQESFEDENDDKFIDSHRSISSNDDDSTDNEFVMNDSLPNIEPRHKYQSEYHVDSESDDSDIDIISPPKLTQIQRKKKKSNFNNERELITKSTFRTFNKIVFNSALSSVEVVWSKRLTSTAGLTRLKRKKMGENWQYHASIELSTKLIDDKSRLQSTLMHEMCHAAAWIIDNIHKPPHGKCFKKWGNLAMRKIDGLLVSTTHEYVTNTFKHAWHCTNPNCNFIVQRHSRSVNIERHLCGKCSGNLEEIEVPSPRSIKQRNFTPKKKRAASGFSLFVQKHSKAVRVNLIASSGSGTGKVTQQEVMKECARLWREQKLEDKV